MEIWWFSILVKFTNLIDFLKTKTKNLTSPSLNVFPLENSSNLKRLNEWRFLAGFEEKNGRRGMKKNWKIFMMLMVSGALGLG